MDLSRSQQHLAPWERREVHGVGSGVRGRSGRTPRTPDPVMGVNKEVTKPYAEQLDDRHSSSVLSPLKKKKTISVPTANTTFKEGCSASSSHLTLWCWVQAPESISFPLSSQMGPQHQTWSPKSLESFG